MKITKRQLRRIIREELDREESFADDQRKIGRMFTRFDRAQIKQAMELNSVLGILPEPINISFPHEDWTELTDDERRELEFSFTDHGSALVKNAMASMDCHTVDEYVEMAKRLDAAEAVDALELNISCPNCPLGGMEFGIEADATRRLVEAVRENFSRAIIAKLTPNVTDVIPIAQAAAAGGADALSLVTVSYTHLTLPTILLL